MGFGVKWDGGWEQSNLANNTNKLVEIVVDFTKELHYNKRINQGSNDMQAYTYTANVILEQIGRGNTRALPVMTGARSFVAHNEERGALSFKLPNNAKDGINFVKVVLTASDTYTVTFARVWGTKFDVKATVENVYCDQLADVFERETGLYVTF